jgi:spore coat protein I
MSTANKKTSTKADAWVDNTADNKAEAGTSGISTVAHNVLKEYGIVPDNLTVVQGGTIKTVWKLSSGGRPYCLKRLKQTYDKALFSVNAQVYIKNSGGLVPGVIPNRHGEPITCCNDQLFVLYEWINGKDLNFSIPADLRMAVRGLAHFHLASKGYRAPEGARISTKLGKWPDQYMSMSKKLSEWKELAERSRPSPALSTYLQHVDRMLLLADKSLKALDSSDYGKLTEQGSKSIVLCHQDYGKGNALAAGSSVYILDLDGVTYDLPARDLRKIIGKNAEKSSRWSAGAISEILGWYTEINPMGADEMEVLHADLLFPHWFYGLVKNLFQNNKSLKASEIEKTALLESSKEESLRLCFRRSG